MVGQAEPPRLMQESAHEAAAVGVPEESLHLGREGEFEQREPPHTIGLGQVTNPYRSERHRGRQVVEHARAPVGNLGRRGERLHARQVVEHARAPRLELLGARAQRGGVGLRQLGHRYAHGGGEKTEPHLRR